LRAPARGRYVAHGTRTRRLGYPDEFADQRDASLSLPPLSIRAVIQACL